MPIYKTSKDEIIIQAYEVFLQKGYYHTSISDLSKACGIEKPHFYYYFKDKKDIMISVLAYFKQWVMDNMFIYAYKPEMSPKKRMEMMLKVLEKVHAKNYYGCIFGNTSLETSANDKDFIPSLKEHFTNWNNALMEIYSSVFDYNEAQLRSQSFLAELNGAVLMTKVFRNRKYLKDFINQKNKELEVTEG